MRLSPLVMACLLLPSPCLASNYEALCGNSPCNISLDASGISGPGGFIPTGRIAQWFTGGQESYNAGSGTAGALGGATAGALGGALLLGPIGLLGGLIGGGIAGSKAGRSADLFFNVVGYDQNGRKTTLSFRFVNPKPANQMRMELPMFTGLAMGQTRPLNDLRAALAANQSGGSASLPDRLEPSPAGGANPAVQQGATTLPAQPQSGGGSLPDSLTTSSAPPTDNQGNDAWLAYLQQRNLPEWARKNPVPAATLRQRLFPLATSP